MIAAGLLFLSTSIGCVAGPYARSGSLGGGLAGGAVGALAGAHSDRPLEGAAIGAVAGSLLGGAAGDQLDRESSREFHAQQAYLQQAQSQAVTVDQVVQMSSNGLGESLIINQMKSNGVIAPLTPNDMVAMKQRGISDNIISAWQQTPTAGSIPRTARIQPVIVQPMIEANWGPDCYHYPHPRHHRPRHWY